MNLRKLFLTCIIALGLAACSDTDDAVDGAGQGTTKGNSYASVAVKFPKGTYMTKALPGDFNEGEAWSGRDDIETITVFLVNSGTGVVDYNSFSKNTFEGIDVNGVLKPNLALKATAGEQIRVYTVINGNADILATLKATSAANFATAFASEAAKIASEVAKYNAPEAPATTGTETIMMTNDEDNYVINIVSGVTEEEAKLGTGNYVSVQVERVVSRALLTVVPSPVDGWPVSDIVGGSSTEIARVTGVAYAVGQSNKKFYIMKKSNYAVPNPVYEYVPAGSDWTTNNTYFDYSGLASFTPVQQFVYNTANINIPLTAEATSKFVLPVNHAVNLSTPVAQRPFYKKGNTTYFEIRATFVPAQIDGVNYNGLPTTVFWGANDKKFYSTRALAEAEGQEATEFENGIMKYILWLNPNSLVATVSEPNPMVSPTIRNQVYHAHISAFLRMGLPNNPIDPSDPSDPSDPENPIDPTDPLKTDFTYLSTSVKVLPWTIHSYQYSLTGDMY